MFRRRTICLLVCLFTLLAPALVRAEGPFRYPEGNHGRGTLRYIHDIPVLSVAGSPAEMGEQLGTLGLKPAARLLDSADEFVAQHGWKTAYNLVLKSGNLMLPRFPAHHLEEIDAAAQASGWPREMLLFGNTILDLRRIIACSSMIVEADRSTTGGPLLGRNLDWPSVAKLHEYTLVVVYRPEGKRAFASITFPGVFGCTSGINDAGLTVAMLDSYRSNDESSSFNPLGVPTVLLLRRLLEECTTVDEAVALLRANERASMLNIAICDRKRGAVLEVTTKNVIERGPEQGVTLCTNHFRSPELTVTKECWRYEKLLKGLRQDKYSVADIAQRLHGVNQGELTLQSMVFEPASLDLHLVFGPGPASRFPMSRIELAELFRPGL